MRKSTKKDETLSKSDENQTNVFSTINKNSLFSDSIKKKKIYKEPKSSKKLQSENKITKKLRSQKSKFSKDISPEETKQSDNKDSLLKKPLLCEIHNQPIQFICNNSFCFLELCGHCILSHKDHIQHIQGISKILEEYSKENSKDLLNNPQKLINEINTNQKVQMKILDDLFGQINDSVQNKMEVFKKEIINNSNCALNIVENLQNFKTKAFELLNNKQPMDRVNIDLIKKYLQFCNNMNSNLTNSQNFSNYTLQSCFFNSANSSNSGALLKASNKFEKPFQISFNINTSFLLDHISDSIDQNLTLNVDGSNLESTMAGQPKILHWFEWGKKKLNIYDIVTNTTHAIELDITFKIPSFSRSIIIPNGEIYLLGGEEPEYFSRREVYMLDIKLPEKKLIQKASMLHKKFDFTLCFLKGYIYVICGKDSSSEVVDTCERYNVYENSWENIASVKKKRYAASAVGFTNNKVYLFGGRSDFNNYMVAEIEEYNVEMNEWNIIQIRNGSQFWNPVEVCACIQISKDKILVFGGSDARIKDSNTSLIFYVNDYSFDKKGELKRPQVFVTAPFLYGKYVFAIGNEYYMKHRNLHRFSLEKEEWEIIF